jgi:hypothetical protein
MEGLDTMEGLDRIGTPFMEGSDRIWIKNTMVVSNPIINLESNPNPNSNPNYILTLALTLY